MIAGFSSAPGGRAPPTDRRRCWILVGAILAAYAPLWRAGFIWDDDSLLTANPMIRDPHGLYQFWFTSRALDYWPVTSTSFWLEWRVWGLHPLGYHLTNLALHLSTVLLLWAVLRRLRIPGAWVGALLFAVHPINVESVTWIAERKNLLALLFYLGSILWFLKERYWLSLGLFALAMLSKGSVATLPIVLGGIVAWRRGSSVEATSRRLSGAESGETPLLQEILRLAPFFLVAAVLAAVDIWFQRHGRIEIIRTAGWAERIAGAGAVILFYLHKCVWPAHLIFVYPQWQIRPHEVVWWIPLGVVALVTAALVVLARRRRPSAHAADARAALYAWGYFCVSLIPVLGLTDVYFMKFSLVADHYAHLALIAVTAGAGAIAHHVYQSAAHRLRPGLVVLGTAAVGLLAGLTWRQNLNYRSEVVLYRSILADNPESWLAHGNLGMLLAQTPSGDSAARAEFEAALRLKPDYAEAHNNLGVSLAKDPTGLPAAIGHYQAALRAKPDYALAHYNLAAALSTLPGRESAAAAEYESALRLAPDHSDWENDLAVLLAKTPGSLPEAIGHFETAVRLQPDDPEIRYNLANHLMRVPDRLPEAVEQYEAALRLRPDFAAAHFNLGLAYGRAGQLERAIPHFQRVVELEPGNQAARQILARIQAGRQSMP